MCLRHYIKLIWESPTTQKTKLSSVIYAPFIQNSNQMASRLTVTTSFPRVFFSTPVIFRATSKLFGSQGCSDEKTDLIFPAFSSRVADFAVQFCFRCKFIQRGVTLESGLTVARFFSTNHDSLLRIATNEIASFWIDHRSRQLAFFLAKAGQNAGFRVMLKYFEIKSFSLLYKTNRFHVAVRLIQ